MIGQVMTDNRKMLQLANSKGFSRRPIPDDGVFEVKLKLQDD